MDLDFSSAEIEFRDEVRAFIAQALTPTLRRGAAATPVVYAEPDLARAWQAALHARGWLAYHWPVEHGGTGWTPIERYIFEKELAVAGAPELPNLGLKLLAPVLHAFGTPEQQRRYLPRILTGEDYWCQGFSEPQSGSDLASLSTRAVRDGTRYIVDGSKLWTTNAHFADHIFALVRTEAGVKAQRGISFLLIDLRQPGVTVRPIRGLAGDHEVNAVFFDGAVADAGDLIGAEGDGWSIAKFLLENERGGTCHAPRLLADLAGIRRTATERPGGDGRPLIDDPLFGAQLARLEFEALALEMTELRILAAIAEGQKPGPQTSLVKLVAGTIRQQVDAAAMRVWGYAGLQLTRARPLYGDVCPPPVADKAAQVAPARYLNSRAWTIFGGTSEIQRTIIARTVLGL